MTNTPTNQSMNIEQSDRDKLRKIFPQCFTEGKLDIDKLLNMCGEYITDDFERYEFKWKGKSECLQLAQRRSTGTLRPSIEDSVNFDTTSIEDSINLDTHTAAYPSSGLPRQRTQNLYIEGDNLEVLKLLQTSYYRKVKMIYIDPPYNTGNDFVYNDDFTDPIAHYKEVTSQATKSNPETMGRFHTAWLNMMYPRLRLAANLLREDGVCFISIDDNEVHNLRKICDEVFGEENFVAQIPWQSRQSIQNDTDFSINHEYVLAYAKARRIENRRLKESNANTWYNKDSFACYPLPLNAENYDNPDNDPRGPWKADPFDAPNVRPNLIYPIINPNTGDQHLPPSGRCWRTSQERFASAFADNRIVWGKNGTGRPQLKVFYNEKKDFGSVENSWFSAEKIGTTTAATKALQSLFDGNAPFDTPKPITLLTKLMTLAGVKDDDLILDFFSGSSTTAHAVMQLNAEDGGNRRFIMIQLPELTDEKSEAYKAGYKNICEIGKERIRRAGAKIMQEWQEKQTQIEIGKNSEQSPPDIGFRVFKLDTSNLKIWDNTPIPNRRSIPDARYNSIPGVSHDSASDTIHDSIPEAIHNSIPDASYSSTPDASYSSIPDASYSSTPDASHNYIPEAIHNSIPDTNHNSESDTNQALAELERRLRGMLEVIKEDRSNIDVVYEVMLKLGQDLCEDVIELDINGKTVYGVGSDITFIVCLAQSISPEDAQDMAEYAPGRIIFSEQCFDNTTDKSNVKLTLRDRGVVMRVL